MASAIDNHDECRHRVCVLCYGKGKRPLSDREIKKDSVIEGYEIDDLNFPDRLCEQCHF